MLSYLPIGGDMGTKFNRNQNQSSSKVATVYNYLKVKLMNSLHPYSWLGIGLVSLVIMILSIGVDVHLDSGGYFFRVVIFLFLHYLLYVFIQDTIKVYYNYQRNLVKIKLERNTDEDKEIQLRNQVAEEQFQISQEEVGAKSVLTLFSVGVLLICMQINLWRFDHNDQ
ncbi:putative membrane protein [Wickerhamomyces ciferrii]|uniref:Membrane protein n=1 Tax=Wickerhamomyces ciferrii (strain ATCC 14091 / BCRC 22168 / CBS 111 / JCM 3599 / NBRC 0793 / NRRL Y-1031 F-60-10) TaxID=1206466 RepID=K0KI71_WICCF|nr:uncharacterized protein BN7_2250 [Wickerhamomyces ciferrii]CCH42706.1 putative membrane protein [Wickerhamomyces ciferrii]